MDSINAILLSFACLKDTLNDESRIDLFLKYPFIKCMVMKKEQIFMIHCTLLGLMADRT